LSGSHINTTGFAGGYSLKHPEKAWAQVNLNINIAILKSEHTIYASC
jgi:hypothetical protein